MVRVALRASLGAEAEEGCALLQLRPDAPAGGRAADDGRVAEAASRRALSAAASSASSSAVTISRSPSPAAASSSPAAPTGRPAFPICKTTFYKMWFCKDSTRRALNGRFCLPKTLAGHSGRIVSLGLYVVGLCDECRSVESHELFVWIELDVVADFAIARIAHEIVKSRLV